MPAPLRGAVVRGEAAVVARQAQLQRLAERSGYPGAMNDLIYFVGKPGAVEAAALKLRSHQRLPRLLARLLAGWLRRVITREPVLVRSRGDTAGDAARGAAAV